MTSAGASAPFPEVLRSYRAFGSATRTESVRGIPYFINEFWTSRQRQAHRIHELSYRACFKPQLPAFFIERLSEPGDVVYDPFMGRGTTPVEAALHGRIPYGNDINPLSRAFTEPRINPPELSDIEGRLQSIPWDRFGDPACSELLAFFHPMTLARIEGLRAWLRERRASGSLDSTDRWIEMVAVNRLTGHSPGFFSVYTLPPNQAVSVEVQKKINSKRNQVPPLRDVPGIIRRKSASLLSPPVPRASRNLFLTTDSRSTREIPDGAVALTVTSPPFLDIVNYEADNWMRCWFLGIDPALVPIARHRKTGDWRAFVRSTFVELARITRPGGHVAFEVGEVRRGTVNLDEHVLEAVEGLPFEISGVLINAQSFTKTSNCWGVKNNRAGTNTNRIVVLRKRRGGGSGVAARRSAETRGGPLRS